MIRAQVRLIGAGMLAAAIAAQTSSAAAVPDSVDPVSRPLELAGPRAAPIELDLDTEMVVHDWVLCVSQAFAEEIVKARADGVGPAMATYNRLREAKSCGRFPELRVVLRRSLYQSGSELDYDARIFSASVNLGGNWASGFLIFGGVPPE
jgi:hypothetical protein